MDYSLFIYIIGAFLVSLVTNYLVIDLSHKSGIFIDDHLSDLPQKMHTTPTPRIGGLGIFVSLLFMVKDMELGFRIILCIIPAFLAGFLEDLLAKISPLRRLTIMSVSAFMAIYLTDAVVLDFGFIQVPYAMGVFITLIAILGLINGVNLIDGFNGLASGVSLLIFVTHFFVSILLHDYVMAYISLVCIASILGFIVFNFPFGRIFLGDGGAYSLGFLLAVVTIMIVKRHSTISPWYALVTLIYPVWEVIFSFSRRTLIHKLSPLHPDSKHVHQLIFRNLTRQNNSLTTLVIYPVIFLFNALAVYFYDNEFALIIIVAIFIVSYSLFYSYYSRKELLNK
jgi:UDP-N-acetylmuramyl pentapeptide phosphotransferase/UDP-N-acetylglucosamine-1-phosphate transferase